MQDQELNNQDSIIKLSKEDVTEKDVYLELKSRNIQHNNLQKDTILELNEKLLKYSDFTLMKYLRERWADNRRNYYYTLNELKEVSEKVACIVCEDLIRKNNNYLEIQPKRRLFEFKEYLCSLDSFYYEPLVGIATGFALNYKYIITASHVLRECPIDKIYMIYGYYMVSTDSVNLKFNKSDVYTVKNNKFIRDINIDCAALEVDRPIDPRRVIIASRESDIKGYETLLMLGYPMGLPLKINTDGRIIGNNQESNFFYANLGAETGNSGSPVFSFEKKIVGMVVATDYTCYEPFGQCYSYSRNPNPQHSGDKIVRISKIMDLLNKYSRN